MWVSRMDCNDLSHHCCLVGCELVGSGVRSKSQKSNSGPLTWAWASSLTGQMPIPNLFSEEHQSMWIRVHSNDLILNPIPL